jgi:hypothetical protein
MVLGNVGTWNVRNMAQMGNGFPLLFLYTVDTDWSARPISISSCINPSRESVLRSTLEEFIDACGSTWMGYEPRMGFQDGLGLFLTGHLHQACATVYVGHVLDFACNCIYSLLNIKWVDLFHCFLCIFKLHSYKSFLLLLLPPMAFHLRASSSWGILLPAF